jgi:DNA-binding response OmpR family regulator
VSARRVRNAKGEGRRTVLLVEDEPSLLQPVRDLLVEAGYEVLTAADGLEAVEKHAENADRVSVVLLDLSLPRLGGWEAFLKMRQKSADLDCIVASGNVEPEWRGRMVEAGVRAVIRKPYRGAEILKALRVLPNEKP